MTAPEVAALLEIPPRTAEKRIGRAMAQFKVRYTELMGGKWVGS
jgi:DNA-directed RNA polymerase specialized sigma24 family protein